ncbi:MAG: hypothetical protein WCI73_04825 [Phycisphaerae bacterium]
MSVESVGSSTSANLYQLLQKQPTATTPAKDQDGDNDAGNESAEKSGKVDIKG